MSEPNTSPAPRREKVDPRYLPAWDLCRVAHDTCPADHKPVWWACFEAARALGTLGDSEGRTADPAVAEQHLLTARREADAADLLWDNPAAPTQRTPFGEALEAALSAVRRLLAPASAPGSGAIEELLSTAQRLDAAGQADLRRRVLEALGGPHEQPALPAGADPDPLAQARALALVLGFNEMGQGGWGEPIPESRRIPTLDPPMGVGLRDDRTFNVRQRSR